MDTIITNKGASKYPIEAAYKYLNAKIQIHRPSDFLIKIEQVINVNVEDTVVPHIYTDTFGITSTKKLYIFDDYTPSLDDFNFYRYSNNIPYIKILLKIIDGNLYLCVSEDGRYEITIKDLANTAATYSIVNIDKIEKDGLYKEPELNLNYPIFYDNDLGISKFTDKSNNTNGFFLGKEVRIENKVLNITSGGDKPFYCKFRFIFGKYAHGICEILQQNTKWNIKWYYFKPSDNTLNIKSDGINLYINFISISFVYFYNCRSLNDNISFKLIDIPSNWDSISADNVNIVSNNLSLSDLDSNNIILEEGTYIYEGKLCYKAGLVMKGCNGFDVRFKTQGTTDERPSLSLEDKGFTYNDLTLGKFITWNGTRWIDFNGYTPCINFGTSTNRPTNLSSNDKGLQYFDTTLGKPIFVSSIEDNGAVTWVDSTGVEV